MSDKWEVVGDKSRSKKDSGTSGTTAGVPVCDGCAERMQQANHDTLEAMKKKGAYWFCCHVGASDVVCVSVARAWGPVAACNMVEFIALAGHSWTVACSK